MSTNFNFLLVTILISKQDKKKVLKTVTATYKPSPYLVWTLLLFIKGMQVN